MNGKLLSSVFSVLHELNRQTDLCRFLHVQSLSSVSSVDLCLESHRGYSLWNRRTVVNTSSISARCYWNMDLYVFVHLNTTEEVMIDFLNERPKAKHADKLGSVWSTSVLYCKHPLRKANQSQWHSVKWRVKSYVRTVMAKSSS